jgi:hypothetical protein
MKTIVRRLLVVVAMLLPLGLSAQALANRGQQECSIAHGTPISDFIWDGGGLFIDCSGVTSRFFAIAGASCNGSTTSMDTIKIWESMVNTAFVAANKKLWIGFIDSNGSPGPACGSSGAAYITSIEISN